MTDEKIKKWKTIKATVIDYFEVEISNLRNYVALLVDENNTYSVHGDYIESLEGKSFTEANRYFQNRAAELKLKALSEVAKELDLEDQERDHKKSLQDAIKYCSEHETHSIIVGKLPKVFQGNLDCVKDCFFDRDIDNWVTIINVYKLNER